MMDSLDQINLLRKKGDYPSFSERINISCRSPLCSTGIEILQINTGKRCNLFCKHCHVSAGPDRIEMMPKGILERCLEVVENSDISVIDVTGGSPEMNPDMEWFLLKAARLGRRLMVRSNLVILLMKPYEKFIDVYADCGVELIVSLPDYRGSGTDRQRGNGVFQKIIKSLKILNERGYGIEGSGRILNLVHNPAGAFLPASQAVLEPEYRMRLGRDHGVVFNSLYCLVNLPVGRFLDFLVSSGNYEDYIRELCNAYNPAALDGIMCKTTLSVGWNGSLYDCDFNQMLELPVNHGAPRTIFDFDDKRLKGREIVVGNHCYGCVAGAGSSCQGATVVPGNSEGCHENS